jgi:hypothetical protein
LYAQILSHLKWKLQGYLSQKMKECERDICFYEQNICIWHEQP